MLAHSDQPYIQNHRHNLQVQRGSNAPPVFLLPKNCFPGYCVEKGENQKYKYISNNCHDDVKDRKKSEKPALYRMQNRGMVDSSSVLLVRYIYVQKVPQTFFQAQSSWSLNQTTYLLSAIQGLK